MLLSMTGFGESRREAEGLKISVEIRSVNNRYLKLNTRLTEPYQGIESDVEALLRERLHRGTINVSVRVERQRSADEYQLNIVALEAYRRQIEQLEGRWHIAENVPLTQLLLLPGVVQENAPATFDIRHDWPLIRETLKEAIERLCQMRFAEGQAMAKDLKVNRTAIAEHLAGIQQRAPRVVEAYRDRLQERVQKLLSKLGVELDPGDLIREVSVFAERSDISEEIVRLSSHLEQFEKTVNLPKSSGRKLDFLTQEMVRETNTIGAKANDLEITRHVVDIKAAIERIREMVQNVE